MEAFRLSGEAPAFYVENSRSKLSYGELGGRVLALRQLLRQLPRPALVFQFSGNNVSAVCVYLACLAEKIPLGLAEPTASARDGIIRSYAPTAVVIPVGEPGPIAHRLFCEVPGSELVVWMRDDGASYGVVPDAKLALLLMTSGSTGDAKLVRLTLANLLANAAAISSYLALTPDEIAIQSLPFHYSFGLSVLNSHLLAGGAIALTRHSFMRPEFWSAFDDCRCTSFAGVPYMYETLHRLRTNPAARPTLKTLTQAGGSLRPEIARHFNAAAEGGEARLFIMYGQTEATARIAFVPPERLWEKIGTIGVAIPGGELWLESVEGESDRQLYYRGANVMMGYALGPADLARGDEMKGVLPTGDLADRDADGFFRITGRLSRFAKLFGKRINLAPVEVRAEAKTGRTAAAIDGGERLRIFLEGADGEQVETVRLHIADWLGVPPGAVQVTAIDLIPLTPSGKKNYKALA